MTLAVGNANYIHVYYVDIEIDFDVNVDIDIGEILLEFCAYWSRFEAEVFELNSESLCPMRLLQCFCVYQFLDDVVFGKTCGGGEP